MSVAAMFVLGLFLGWLAEWAIDWYHWRPRISRMTRENTDLRQRIATLQSARVPVLLSPKNVPIVDKDGKDNFQAIKGIGPVFARRLKEAGIETFEELSQLKPRQLEEILGNLYKRFFSKQEQIQAQAREFAKQRSLMK